MRLYIEILIRADLEALWRATQDPARHRRWDLRFGHIEPLSEHRFRYSTLGISGVGVHTGDRHAADGSCTSALRFGSDHPLSPIRAGSGYWRYLPTPAGIRFLTSYGYRPHVLPPRLMWWATAWSFDRLRLWLETGRSPVRTLLQSLAEAATRTAAVALTAWLLGPLPALAAAALAVAVPPLPGTPAARRCLRHPIEHPRERPCPRSSSARSAPTSPDSTPSSSAASASGSTAARPA